MPMITLSFCGQRNELADLPLAALPGLGVGGLGIDDGGDEQDGVGAPEFGVAEAGAHAVEALFDHGGVGGRERTAPVLGIHHGVNGQAGFAGGGEDLLGLRGVGRGGAFDVCEAGVAGDLEAVEDGEFLGEHAEFDGLADGETRRGGGGQEGRGGEELSAGKLRHVAIVYRGTEPDGSLRVSNMGGYAELRARARSSSRNGRSGERCWCWRRCARRRTRSRSRRAATALIGVTRAALRELVLELSGRN